MMISSFRLSAETRLLGRRMNREPRPDAEQPRGTEGASVETGAVRSRRRRAVDQTQQQLDNLQGEQQAAVTRTRRGRGRGRPAEEPSTDAAPAAPAGEGRRTGRRRGDEAQPISAINQQDAKKQQIEKKRKSDSTPDTPASDTPPAPEVTPAPSTGPNTNNRPQESINKLLAEAEKIPPIYPGGSSPFIRVMDSRNPSTALVPSQFDLEYVQMPGSPVPSGGGRTTSISTIFFDGLTVSKGFSDAGMYFNATPDSRPAKYLFLINGKPILIEVLALPDDRAELAKPVRTLMRQGDSNTIEVRPPTGKFRYQGTANGPYIELPPGSNSVTTPLGFTLTRSAQNPALITITATNSAAHNASLNCLVGAQPESTPLTLKIFASPENLEASLDRLNTLLAIVKRQADGFVSVYWDCRDGSADPADQTRNEEGRRRASELAARCYNFQEAIRPFKNQAEFTNDPSTYEAYFKRVAETQTHIVLFKYEWSRCAKEVSEYARIPANQKDGFYRDADVKDFDSIASIFDWSKWNRNQSLVNYRDSRISAPMNPLVVLPHSEKPTQTQTIPSGRPGTPTPRPETITGVTPTQPVQLGAGLRSRPPITSDAFLLPIQRQDRTPNRTPDPEIESPGQVLHALQLGNNFLRQTYEATGAGSTEQMQLSRGIAGRDPVMFQINREVEGLKASLQAYIIRYNNPGITTKQIVEEGFKIASSINRLRIDIQRRIRERPQYATQFSGVDLTTEIPTSPL